MPRSVKARTVALLRDDADGKKAEKLLAKMLRKNLKRRDKDGAVVADIEITEHKPKAPKDPKVKTERGRP